MKDKKVGRPIPPNLRQPTKSTVKHEIHNSFVCKLLIDRLPALLAVSVGMHQSLIAKKDLYWALTLSMLTFIIVTIATMSMVYAVIYISQAIRLVNKWQKYEKMVEIYKKYNPQEAQEYYFPKFKEEEEAPKKETVT